MITSRTKHKFFKPKKIFIQQKNKIRTKKTAKLKNKNGELKTEDKEILKIAKKFYSDL